MLALIALLAVAPSELSELTLDVDLYLGTDVDEEVLESALREVDQIFAPGGIRLRFRISPDDSVPNPTVTVVLQPRPARFVIRGCSRNRHDHRLGHTSFTARRITLWSEQIARAVHGDWDRLNVPKVSDTAYARALGRVLAHELGHVFLRLSGHRNNGLMRQSFSHRSLRTKSNRDFLISDKDLEKMRAALERARKKGTGASSLTSPPPGPPGERFIL